MAKKIGALPAPRRKGFAALFPTMIVALGAAWHPSAATAQDWFKVRGSLGEGGFTRYVPPATNAVFNETPLITTELRPLYFHQTIPNDFLTDGGNIDIIAAQARLALTERLGLIATTDGYAWADFDSTLSDSHGWADLGLGMKYAAYYNPAEGEILTVGARYTAPTGSLNVGEIALTGYGSGSVNAFVSGLKLFDDLQLQGSVGIQQALASDNTSMFYASAHASYEIAPGLYPLVEVNAFIPYDGGDRQPDSKLTGFDVADFGSSDPRDTVTLAGGLRWRVHENAILGGAFEYNVNEDSNSLFEWRSMVDVAIHF